MAYKGQSSFGKAVTVKGVGREGILIATIELSQNLLGWSGGAFGSADVCRTYQLNIRLLPRWHHTIILPILTQNKMLGALMCANITGYT